MSDHADESSAARPLHGLFVVDDDILARFGPALRQLVIGFMDESIRITLLSRAGLSVNSLLVGATKSLNYMLARWPLRSRSVRQLLERMGTDEPDVVHAWTPQTAPLAREVSLAFDVPLIVHLTSRDDLALLDAPWDLPPTRYVAISLPLFESARRALGDRADRVALVRMGLHAGSTPACFATADRTPTLLNLTRFQGQHGLEAFLEAARDLKKSAPDLMVVLMGTGPNESQLRRRVVSLGLLKTVTFTGPIANRQAAIEGADILVTSRPLYELRIQHLEAMSAGLAVVAARGGVDDYLIDEQTALLYDPASPGQLALQLAQLLEHRDMARRLAAAAQEHIRQRHQPSAMISAMAELYRQLALNQATVKLPTPQDG